MLLETKLQPSQFAQPDSKFFNEYYASDGWQRKGRFDQKRDELGGVQKLGLLRRTSVQSCRAPSKRSKRIGGEGAKGNLEEKKIANRPKNNSAQEMKVIDIDMSEASFQLRRRPIEEYVLHRTK